MITCLLKGFLSGVAVKVLIGYRRLSVQLINIEAARWYLHGVQIARRSAVGLMLMGLVIALICVGLLLLHAGLFVLLPWTLKSKALLGVFLGLAYVVIGGVSLHAAMNEKTWMEKSGAAAMLKEAIGQSVKD